MKYEILPQGLTGSTPCPDGLGVVAVSICQFYLCLIALTSTQIPCLQGELGAEGS